MSQPCDEGVIKSKPAKAPCPKASAPWILAATILGSSMVFIDGTVVNVALPALQTNLNATVVDVQWVVEAYALFLAALLLAGGSLGDHFGRKRIYTIGVVLFAMASIWCGIAPNINHLIMARAVQGVGGALLVPGSLAIISASFGEDERGKAIGTWSGFTAITAAIGPVLGGWLIEHVSWRAVFFINVPLALIVLALVYLHVPESRDEDSRGLDWIGAMLATVSLGAIVYGLIESSRRGGDDPAIVAALVSGLLIAIVFLIVEARRGKNAKAKVPPMLPLRLFRSHNFGGANLLTLFLYTALSGALFFLPLNLIQVQAYTEKRATKRRVKEERQQVCSAEIARAKQPQRQHRRHFCLCIFSPTRFDNEKHNRDQQAGNQSCNYCRVITTSSRRFDQTINDRAQTDSGEHRSYPIQPTGIFIATFRHVQVDQSQHNERQRHVNEEYRSPGNMFYQPTPEHRANRGRDGRES